MNLKSLLLCSDEKIVRVLRRTLGDLDIKVELCADADTALRKLTRERFEAIIVDCAGPGAAAVLRSTRTAPCNKRAIAVAILDAEMGLRSAFDLGAHFTLYKPVSVEKSKSSFRAARALMKKERRRNERVPVNIPVEMSSRESGARIKANTIDLGEGGLALNLPRRSKPQGRWEVGLTLPGSDKPLKMEAEFAWEGTGTQVGLRFENQSPETARQLREWLGKNAPDVEKDDPPVACRLTHLTLGGCYLELFSPFPASTRVTLSMTAGDVDLKTEGVVRVMHADKGMGVEFTRTTPEHRAMLEKFLALLAENRDLQPELLVEPEGLEIDTWNAAPAVDDDKDVLLELFRSQAGLPAEAFLEKLGKQRGLDSVTVGASA
jgi:CheY-like chemotaxis protein